ncbi:MAG: hypothetical protein WCY19_06270 [Candidatus Gastranaerophilaceae bacterium]
MRAEAVDTNWNLSFKMAFKPVPKKALEIGEQALIDAMPTLESKGLNKEIEIIPKKGFLTKIQSLIIFVSNKGSKRGEWFCLSKDPKGLLHIGKRYKTVDSFTKENIISATEAAEQLLENSEKPVSKYTAYTFPADAALITKLFKL